MKHEQTEEQNSFNKGGMIAFVFCMVFTLGFFVYVTFIYQGIDMHEVDADQSGAEPVMAVAATPARVIDVASIKEAWKPSDDLVEAGHQLYKTNCSMCHGVDYKGNGPAGAALKPPPRNFIEGKWKYGGNRLGLMKVLREGSPGTSMQSYKTALTVNQRWALVHFLRSITGNKVADTDAEVGAAAASLQ
jgi:high-affinity iron transporter